VQGIIDLVTAPGLINLDFADIRSVMTDAGPALIGLGRGRGEHRATDAARHAIASPLLEASIDGARGILFNVSGPADLRLREVKQAAEAIREHADPDANVIFGASFNESLGEDVLITLIATGLNKHEQARPTRAEVRPVDEARVTRAEVRPLDEATLKPAHASPPKAPAQPPDTHEPQADRVAGPAQHIRPRSAAGADASDPAPRRSRRATEDDLEVPSFLRRRG
jgi:cell division protein FtsZ